MIKNTDKIKKIPFSAIILLILISVLLMSSKHMIMSRKLSERYKNHLCNGCRGSN